MHKNQQQDIYFCQNVFLFAKFTKGFAAIKIDEFCLKNVKKRGGLFHCSGGGFSAAWVLKQFHTRDNIFSPTPTQRILHYAPKTSHPPIFYIFCKTQPPRHPAWGYSQNTTEGRKSLCCVHFTEFSLAAGDNPVLPHLPADARGNQPGIVNGIPLVDGGATDIVEFRAFPGQGRGRALAA